jgi:hypothetical protein
VITFYSRLNSHEVRLDPNPLYSHAIARVLTHMQAKKIPTRSLIYLFELPHSKRLFEGASFYPDRLHNRPEAARFLLTLVTACSDRDIHTI